ncbi:formimidoylglutamase [Lysinibacillus odysseyi]|uniref:Formimidoylglutamase n=1 Tax=Lysinibacillus odysseyi 34hs-1 = NBRC 100172 TaxID=1220589 RepID=A0A0A3IIH2_9BACI|nr:formimidoylglutamase [Lysinibacillus odysseyi]KGR84529.1 formimidoylglutamase [Lysinibacillus odysseyi 34hs-1 = NBRC 100172]
MHKETDVNVWQGRIDHETDSTYFRYHQVVQTASTEGAVGIIGFACDEGVRRNNGRVGAKDAPLSLRKQLASLPWRHQVPSTSLIDFGDVICEGEQLERAQQELGDKVADILAHGKAIVLGGGHETLYGQYLGVRKAAGPDASIGLLNIDAHFDMRSYDKQPSSGTMFKQILDEDPHAHYFVCGIQQYGNTTALFETADQYGVAYFFDDQLESDAFTAALQDFMNAHDVLLVTLCMDVLNAAEAPGVSAPSPFGLSAVQVRDIVRKMVSHEKTISFSICEVNPSLDIDNRTAKLGAYFINEAIMNI